MRGKTLPGSERIEISITLEESQPEFLAFTQGDSRT
jgi:hypothetical protein